MHAAAAVEAEGVGAAIVRAEGVGAAVVRASALALLLLKVGRMILLLSRVVDALLAKFNNFNLHCICTVCRLQVELLSEHD